MVFLTYEKYEKAVSDQLSAFVKHTYRCNVANM